MTLCRFIAIRHDALHPESLASPSYVVTERYRQSPGVTLPGTLRSLREGIGFPAAEAHADMVAEGEVDFWGAILVLLRRWYVALPVFLLCLGSARLVYDSVPVRYASTSVMVLTAPTNGGTLYGGPEVPTSITNPLLNFAAGLNTTGAVLVQALNSSAVVNQLTASVGPGTSYQVTNGSTNPELMVSSPFLYIEGESTSAARARDIVVRVAQRARDELATEQKTLDAPPSTYITIAEFVPPTTPQLQQGGKLRALIAALLISVLASLTATFAAESIFEARRRRRSVRRMGGQHRVQYRRPGWGSTVRRVDRREQFDRHQRRPDIERRPDNRRTAGAPRPRRRDGALTARLTELDRSTEFLAPQPRGADGATLACLFVVPLMIIPSRLVIRGIPLSITLAIVVGIGISVCLFFAHFTSTLGVAKGRSAVRTAIIVYLCAVLATYGYATYGYLPPDERPLTDHSLVNILAVAGVALFVCDGVRGRDRLDFVLKTVAVCGAVVAGIGTLQFMIGFDLTKYLALPIFRFGAETSGVIDARASFRRPAGTTGTPIEFGVVCAMVMPLALHYGFRARERSERVWGWWICCALLAAGAMFSISRSAILGLAAGGIILFIGWPRGRRSKALLVSVAFLLAMKLLIPGLLGTIYGLFYHFNSDGSVTYRTHDYPVAVAEIAQHVWLGRGPGTWYAPKHQVFDNQYLSTLVEGGVIGLVAFAVLLLTGIYAAARALYLAVDPEQRELALTLMACLIVPVIGAGTFDLLGFGTATGLTFVLLGAAGSLVRIASR